MAKCSIESCLETRGVVPYKGGGPLLCGKHWHLHAQADAVTEGKEILCEDCIKRVRPEGVAGLLRADQGECQDCHRQAWVWFYPP